MDACNIIAVTASARTHIKTERPVFNGARLYGMDDMLIYRSIILV